MAPMAGVVPAVTTTAQTSMLTGALPQEHGIVANGWYFRELGEVWLWRQSEALVEAHAVWERLHDLGAPIRVLKHFWWYAMNSTADYLATPRPAYHADGRKSPDFYTSPPELHGLLESRHGAFPLFNFWGPTADIRSSRWIAEAFVTADQRCQCDLSLCYLPHLDYDLQRFGPEGPHLAANLRQLDDCVGLILARAVERRARVLLVSEYGLAPVNRAVRINRLLRKAGLLAVTTNATGELLDCGASRAFAVADHQIAHVYCSDDAAQSAARALLEADDAIEHVYGGGERAAIGLDHERSGELVALAAPDAWFAYDYWLEAARRPDFARCVEIHKKPGYDPRELFFDPVGGKLRAILALARKKLGLRYRMDPVPLDTSLVRGSHGRPAARAEEGPVIIGSDPAWRDEVHSQTDVAALLEHLLIS